MLADRLSGIYHAGAPRRLSLYQIAQIINRVGGYDPDCLMGIPRDQAGPIPPRAGNVCMDCGKLIAGAGLRSVRSLALWRLVGAHARRMAPRASPRPAAFTGRTAPGAGHQPQCGGKSSLTLVAGRSSIKATWHCVKSMGPVMRARNPRLTVFTTASYLLTIVGAALFHDHHHGEEQHGPGVSASHATGGHECSVCQFMAQKPAPAADITPVSASAPVSEVLAVAPACAVRGVFAAWHSRALPLGV